MRLFRTLVLKEARGVLRDRQNLIGLVSLALTLAFVLWAVEQGESRPGSSPGGALEPAAVTAVRFIVVAIAQSLAAYASFFAIPLALASFVGEKESQTLELLLAAPIPDRKLYVLKVSSVVLLGACFGYVLLAMFLGWAVLVHADGLARLPSGEVLRLIALALPLPPLYAGVQVGLGSCVSVRADSMKGAGQLLGGVYMLIFVVAGGCLVVSGGGGSGAAQAVGQRLETLSFWSFYWTTLGLPAALGAGLLALDGRLFRRERLLS